MRSVSRTAPAIALLTLAATFGAASAAHAEDGVMEFGKVKLQGPPASDVEHPKEPYVSGQFLNVNPKDGPLRIQAKVKDAKGKAIEAVIDIRGSIDWIAKTKSFPIAQYRDTPGKAFIKFDDGGNLACSAGNGGIVSLTAVGKEGGIISGTFSGVKWFTKECQQALTGSGSFRVQRAENY